MTLSIIFYTKHSEIQNNYNHHKHQMAFSSVFIVILTVAMLSVVAWPRGA
jgi:hypothetical protein